jgi:site-specific recombinase XerD
MLALRARNLSPATLRNYSESVRQFSAWLDVSDPAEVSPTLVTTYLAEVGQTRAPKTLHSRYTALRLFFDWALDEGEVEAHPMARIKRPTVPERPIEVPPEDGLRALLKSLDGRDFTSRRDIAVIRLWMDTGMRRSELAGLTVADVDLRDQVAIVMGKGRRPRAVPFGNKTAQALDRYLRMRAKHPRAKDAALWLGDRGRGKVSAEGLYVMLRRRCADVGINVHPHQLRHFFAHTWLAAGGTEGDLMRLAGWKSRSMLDRYGSALAAERARDSHRRLALGDRF